MSFRKINAIFMKQLNHSYKNLNVASMVVVMLVISFGFSAMIDGMADGEGVNHVNNMVSTLLGMNILMVGTLIMCFLISEEKEKNTLQVLMTSTVSPVEFLIGNGLMTLLATTATSAVIMLMFGWNEFSVFILLVSAFTSIAGIVMGALVGILSRNQTEASAISTPFVFGLMMTPMFFGNNEIVQTIFNYLFIQNMVDAIINFSTGETILMNLVIIAGNILVLFAIFTIVYRRIRMSR